MNTPIVNTFSMGATRSHPWEGWREPEATQATYFGLAVRVIDQGYQLAIIEWAGHRMLVETADLQVE